MMDPKVKAQWIEALRSGAYLQGQGYLKSKPTGLDEPEYCCLGVLVECQNEEFVSSIDGEGVAVKDHEGNRSRTQLTKALLVKYRLTGSQQRTLIRLNDEDDLGFCEIADWIEETL